jgi:hypothetical protein
MEKNSTWLEDISYHLFVTCKTKDDSMFIKSLIKISIKKSVMDFIVSKP